MKKRLPIGISDFEEMITQNYYFVDKSLLIKEFLDSRAKVTLIPRPRRFGKTLNISMLKCFFEKKETTQAHLFKNLAISTEPEYMQHQGKYPVIFLTFKDVKDPNWDKCYENITQIIADEFARHEYLLESNTLRPFEKSEFEKIINLTASSTSYLRSLRKLSFYLHRHYKQKPLILIDEYDAPIHSGFINKYYDDIINFIRIFLSAGLKDNPDLEISALTGILKIAKESIFSDLNNLEVCSILEDRYSDKFGLLENEVKDLVKYYELSSRIEDITKWYNGYMFGENIIYNPWSIINFAKANGRLQPYWVNTSSNLIIKELIINGCNELKEDLEILLSGKEVVNKPIYENIVFQDIFINTDVLWSFLIFSGYISFDKKELIEGTYQVNIKIPNTEVKRFFQNTISNWFTVSLSKQKYNEMLENLISGNIKIFSRIFKDFVLKSFSYFDVSGNEPEKFYHAFVLGLLVGLNKTHKIKSNRESGYGRYDVMIIPDDKTKPGIIIEFKKAYKDDDETLEMAAKQALEQIEIKQYETELKDLGINNVIKLAIVFDGKSVLIKN